MGAFRHIEEADLQRAENLESSILPQRGPRVMVKSIQSPMSRRGVRQKVTFTGSESEMLFHRKIGWPSNIKNILPLAQVDTPLVKLQFQGST